LGKYVKPAPDKDYEFDAATSSIGNHILCKFVVDNHHDARVLREMIQELDKEEFCAVSLIHPDSTTEKYDLKTPEPGSKTELLATVLQVDDPMAFNCLADELATSDNVDNGYDLFGDRSSDEDA